MERGTPVSDIPRVNFLSVNSVWSRKDEEYIPDFCLVSKRHLSEAEHQLFKFHFLMGADWRICCRRLKMDKGNFFHMVYRIEQRLGRVYRELEPYALFLLDSTGPERR